MAFKDRLRKARTDAGLTQNDIAKVVDTTPQAVSGWERGEAVPEIDKLPAIARRVRRSLDWLLGADARGLSSEDIADSLDPPPSTLLKVTGYVGANGQTGFYALAQERYETIPGSSDDPPGAVALEIMGTSAGQWFDRWFVVINEVQSTVAPDMIGRPCVVWLHDGRVLFKEIRKNGALFDLHANDPNEPPIKGVKVKSAAKVLRIIHR